MNIDQSKRNSALTLASATAALLAPVTASAQVGSSRDAVGMSGTINHRTREIYLTGSLTDKDNFNTVIAVVLLNVPKGKWRMTKAEHNGQSKGWGLWALQLGYATRFVKTEVPKCNYFRRMTFVDSRNCLVFDDGSVLPNQTLIKSWTMLHGEGPIHVLHYERPETMGAPLTEAEIKKGWGNKAVDQMMNVTLQEI